MPNDWFQFKQFTVRQDKCAMKVSTDACIQGAWAAAVFAETGKADVKILDIGAGTGLLTLMIAQSMPKAHFDAIEINEDAYGQAVANFGASDWGNRITAHYTSLADFKARSNYDLIICNPPFFQNHLESPAKARNDARHSQSLSKEALAESVATLLKDDGLFCVMYPATEWNRWTAIAHKNGLYVWKQLNIQPTPLSKTNRVVGLIAKKKNDFFQENTFTIYDVNKRYTTEMEILMKEYYLS